MRRMLNNFVMRIFRRDVRHIDIYIYIYIYRMLPLYLECLAIESSEQRKASGTL